MPANMRYPWETPEQFTRRQAAQRSAPTPQVPPDYPSDETVNVVARDPGVASIAQTRVQGKMLGFPTIGEMLPEPPMTEKAVHGLSHFMDQDEAPLPADIRTESSRWRLPNIPNYLPQRKDPRSLTDVVRDVWGIESGSPADVGLRFPGEVAKTVWQAPQDAWKYLTKAPVQTPPPLTPDESGAGLPEQIFPGPPLMALSQLPPPSTPLGPDEVMVDRAWSGGQPGPAPPQIKGRMSYFGPRLNAESKEPRTFEALQGLQANQFQPPPYRSNLVRTEGGNEFRQGPGEELYRQAYASPEMVAPGASEQALQGLRERLGEEEFGRTLGQQEQSTIRTAGAQLHPAVQAAEEAKYRRGAYGQAAYAAGLAEQADITADGLIDRAMIDLEKGNTEAFQKSITDLMQMRVDLVTGVDIDLDDPDDPGNQELQRIDQFLQILNLTGTI